MIFNLCNAIANCFKKREKKSFHCQIKVKKWFLNWDIAVESIRVWISLCAYPPRPHPQVRPGGCCGKNSFSSICCTYKNSNSVGLLREKRINHSKSMRLLHRTTKTLKNQSSCCTEWKKCFKTKNHSKPIRLLHKKCHKPSILNWTVATTQQQQK